MFRRHPAAPRIHLKGYVRLLSDNGPISGVLMYTFRVDHVRWVSST